MGGHACLLPGATEGKVSRAAQLVDAAGVLHFHAQATALPNGGHAGVADRHDGPLALPVEPLVRIPKQIDCHCHPCTTKPASKVI